MVEIITGFISGIVSGIGMGGGTILILFLTLFTNMDQHVAQATNLIFFIPTSIAAIIMNAKQKLIDVKLALWIGSLGILGAIGGSVLAGKIESSKLRRYFGIFLAIIAIHEIYSYIKVNILDKKSHTINSK